MIKTFNWPILRLNEGDTLLCFRHGASLITTVPIISSVGSPEILVEPGEVVILVDANQFRLGAHRVLDLVVTGKNADLRVHYILTEEKDEEEGA